MDSCSTRRKKSSNKIYFDNSVPNKEESLEQAVCRYLRERDNDGDGFTLEHLNSKGSFTHPEKPHGRKSQRCLYNLLKEMQSLVEGEWSKEIVFKLAEVPQNLVPTKSTTSEIELQQRATEQETLEQAVCKYLQDKGNIDEGLTLEHLVSEEGVAHRDKPRGKGCQKKFKKLLQEMKSLKEVVWEGKVAFKLSNNSGGKDIAKDEKNLKVEKESNTLNKEKASKNNKQKKKEAPSEKNGLSPCDEVPNVRFKVPNVRFKSDDYDFLTW